MSIEKNRPLDREESRSENFKVWLNDPMLYDRLHTLSAEYSVPVELLVNLAVKRLIDDVDLVRSLRMGKVREG